MQLPLEYKPRIVGILSTFSLLYPCSYLLGKWRNEPLCILLIFLPKLWIPNLWFFTNQDIVWRLNRWFMHLDSLALEDAIFPSISNQFLFFRAPGPLCTQNPYVYHPHALTYTYEHIYTFMIYILRTRHTSRTFGTFHWMQDLSCSPWVPETILVFASFFFPYFFPCYFLLDLWRDVTWYLMLPQIQNESWKWQGIY